MNNNHLLIELVLIEHDPLSRWSGMDVNLSAAIDMLNVTINSMAFIIDMSGYTGSDDVFTAIENSLGTWCFGVQRLKIGVYLSVFFLEAKNNYNSV